MKYRRMPILPPFESVKIRYMITYNNLPHSFFPNDCLMAAKEVLSLVSARYAPLKWSLVEIDDEN